MLFRSDISIDRGYVENIYKNILGKDYSQDPDGINAWVRHLQLGNSRGDTLVKLFEVATFLLFMRQVQQVQSCMSISQ